MMTTIRRSAREEFTIDVFALLIGKCDPVRNFLERTKATDAHLRRLIQCANVDAGRIRLVALNHLQWSTIAAPSLGSIDAAHRDRPLTPRGLVVK